MNTKMKLNADHALTLLVSFAFLTPGVESIRICRRRDTKRPVHSTSTLPPTTSTNAPTTTAGITTTTADTTTTTADTTTTTADATTTPVSTTTNWSTKDFGLASSVPAGAKPSGPLKPSTVTSIDGCHDSCLKNPKCLIFIFESSSTCTEYGYIPKRELKQPSGAVIYKKNRLISAETVIKNLYWDTAAADYATNEKNCKDKKGTLVSPKTEDAFWLTIVGADESKRYYVGVNDKDKNAEIKYADGTSAGANGYTPPIEDKANLGDHETNFILLYKNKKWFLADVADNSEYGNICDVP